jgi:PAS domain S-box-containing protein
MVKLSVGEATGKIQERLDWLERHVATSGGARGRQLAEAVNAVRETLEEVEAVETELARQNEELITTREALEIERFRYQDLFDMAPDSYLVTDAHGTIEESNLAASELLATSRKALAGKPLAVFLAPESRADFRRLLSMLRPGERLENVEIAFRPPHARASRITLATVSRDEVKPGASSQLRWLLRDISERRVMEAALRVSEERLRHSQRLESIGRLAGGIAHSFNNLLAAIAFHAELLGSELSPGSRGRRHAEEVLKAGDRAAALARQLLAFGRKQVLQPKVLSLNTVVDEMKPMLQRLIGEHIVLETALDPGAGSICVDLGQLEQVVLNLVVNARDAMPDGGRLTLRTGREILERQETSEGEEMPSGSYAVLAVRDTGSGMEPEVLSRLFEPFFTTKDRDKGSGLGLATVHGIVHQSGGGIRVESTPGQGTRFTIFLPHTEEAAEPMAETGAVVSHPQSQGSEVVLLVEDEDNIREPAQEVLESRGYTVLAASDASEALAIAQVHQGPIHLLVTDVVMPGMSGSQLAERLSAVRPEARVLYISGYPEDSISHYGVLQQPGPSFLQKPFPPGVLLSTVRSVLDSEVPPPEAAGR